MSTGKRHKSPKTGQWERCTTDACPYGDIPAAAYAKLLPTVKRSETPVAKHLVLSRIDLDSSPDSERDHFAAVKTDEQLRIAPKGYTGTACNTCGAYLPEGYWEAAQPAEPDQNGPYRTPCPNPECADEVYPTDCQIDVSGSDAKYWDDLQVRRDHWFHITTRENWLESAVNGGKQGEAILAHLGSREAALWRMRDLMVEAKKKAPSDGETMPTYYLYELELDASAPISPHVMEDQIEGWPETELPPEDIGDPYDALNRQIAQSYQQDGITRYLNVCEAPGTVSLMANAKRLRQVAVHTIPVV